MNDTYLLEARLDTFAEDGCWEWRLAGMGVPRLSEEIIQGPNC